jgi:2,4-dienoyl-CoA reductase-like NADH-dependent reductase (Old Yellow Enzyme family)
MTTESNSALFEPVEIGPVTLRNRTIRAAAFEGLGKAHSVTDALIDYHVAIARGGVGMTTVAYAAVEQRGLSFDRQLWMRPDAVAGLRRLTDAVHKEGARVSVQLAHCGNMAHSEVCGGRPQSASEKFNLYGPTFPQAMDEHDIRRVIDAHVDAVSLAREAGFDAVEVHAGHGYLISQFLSPWTNVRRDQYGGTLQNRLRFAREVLSAVKREAGSDIAVLVKTNLRDGFEGGIELDDAVVIAKAFEQDGVDALVLTGGFVSRAPMYVMRGSMPTRVMAEIMDDPMLALGLKVVGQKLIKPLPYESRYFRNDALAVRGAVKLPLVYLGGVDSGPAAHGAIADGFDAVGMARALIREPDFVDKIRRDPSYVSPCDHCNFCAAQIYTRAASCHHREPPSPKLQALLRKDMAK